LVEYPAFKFQMKNVRNFDQHQLKEKIDFIGSGTAYRCERNSQVVTEVALCSTKLEYSSREAF